MNNSKNKIIKYIEGVCNGRGRSQAGSAHFEKGHKDAYEIFQHMFWLLPFMSDCPSPRITKSFYPCKSFYLTL